MKEKNYETPECVLVELNVSSAILSASFIESYPEDDEAAWL